MNKTKVSECLERSRRHSIHTFLLVTQQFSNSFLLKFPEKCMSQIQFKLLKKCLPTYDTTMHLKLKAIRSTAFIYTKKGLFWSQHIFSEASLVFLLCYGRLMEYSYIESTERFRPEPKGGEEEGCKIWLKKLLDFLKNNFSIWFLPFCLKDKKVQKLAMQKLKGNSLF